MFVFDTVRRTVFGAFHPATQTAVDTEFVSDIARSFPPEVYVIERLVHEHFAITDTGDLYAENAMMGIVHLRLYLYPFIFKLLERDMVDKYPFRACPVISRVDNLHPAVAAISIAARSNGDKGSAVVSFLRFQLMDVAE